MISVSFDPAARALYWYFTEIEAGAVALEGECAATLLLDDEGHVIGCELELDESIQQRDLVFALGQPQTQYRAAEFVLAINVTGEEPATLQPLAETAILDFDAAESLLGFELITAPEFELGRRLARLQAFLVSADDVAEDDGRAEAIDDARGAEWGGAAADQDARDAGERGAGSPGRRGAGPGSAGERERQGAEEQDALDALQPRSRPAPPASPVLRSPPPASTEASASPITRSGFVAIVGRPNVGKSTLLNTLLGQKVAIVSRKPQTTRYAIRGIMNRGDAQIIFVDTPGIHQPRNRLGSYMVDQARRAIPDADVVCLVVDINEAPGKLDRQIAALVQRSRAPKLLVLNKVDLPAEHGAANLQAYRELAEWDMELAVSALRGEGIETLVDEIVRRLPTGTQLYPTDQLTDQNERDIAAELVREQVLRNIDEEVPHGVAVEVEEWEQKERALYIRMTVYVEKDSQKGILIGAGGVMLKKIGSAARFGIERELGQPVFLDLWVKPRPNWRDDPSSLRWLGYQDS